MTIYGNAKKKVVYAENDDYGMVQQYCTFVLYYLDMNL